MQAIQVFFFFLIFSLVLTAGLWNDAILSTAEPQAVKNPAAALLLLFQAQGKEKKQQEKAKHMGWDKTSSREQFNGRRKYQQRGTTPSAVFLLCNAQPAPLSHHHLPPHPLKTRHDSHDSQ